MSKHEDVEWDGEWDGHVLTIPHLGWLSWFVCLGFLQLLSWAEP